MNVHESLSQLTSNADLRPTSIAVMPRGPAIPNMDRDLWETIVPKMGYLEELALAYASVKVV
jgi:hypothetical protein